MRDLYWQSDAWLEYVDLQKDKILCKKINNLIKDILRNGYQAGYGKVELLITAVRIPCRNRISRVNRNQIVPKSRTGTD